MILDREPVANEKEITPIIIKKIDINFSPTLYACISPYPTVTIVVTT